MAPPASNYDCECIMMAALPMSEEKVHMIIFPPDDVALKALGDAVGSATHSLTLCCNELTCPKTAHAVAKVNALPNTRVRVLVDEAGASKRNSLVRYLRDKGVPITLAKDGVEFSFCEVDGDLLLVGSMDWACWDAQVVKRHNFVAQVYGTHGNMPEQCADIVSKHWPHGWPQQPEKTAAAATSRALLPPALATIVGRIESAKKFVLFASPALNSRAIADALIRVNNRPGTEVEVILSRDGAVNENSQALHLIDSDVCVKLTTNPEVEAETLILIDDDRVTKGTTRMGTRTDEEWTAVVMDTRHVNAA